MTCSASTKARFWTALAVSAIALGLSLPPARPAAATPFGVQIRSQHFNMCSNVCNMASTSRNWPLVFMVGLSPHTVSLNEACLSDVLWLQGQTGYQPAAWYTAKTGVAACGNVPGFGKAFGNAAFVVGSAQQGYERRFAATVQNDTDVGKSEYRGMACARAETFVGPLVSCSSHLTNHDDNDAIQQSNAYSFTAAVTSPTAGVSLRVLAGDFNLSPSQRPSVWTSSYGRISTGTTASAPSPTATIDYIHVLNPNYTGQVVESNRSCPAAANTPSDHCYIMGTFY